MYRLIAPLLLTLAFSGSLAASDFDVDVPMHLKGASTFYISGRIGTMPVTEFMVDTGSSYMTINEETLASLKLTEEPIYLRDLTGILANGDTMRVPVYAVSQVQLGDGCLLEEVEVAVFPGATRQILGLSVLLRAAPFVFSTNPPQLQLSNCTLAKTKTGDQTVLATGIENL
ncbi:MAG: retroviral-like aspartic protease family protein [Candidatus Thiodiazotropha sp. (ex Semelilucina semeliformis)]|nr:retroviral-like aspartic protease family protein [Candidatus Thiodiazotropha sp. (ex Myrtea spinifera)]MCU7806982.1 retroviral-like aspartic protease family protein [Candidatus Thiodiazotropha sp. (ex Semelilucina semeliformis)]MCU7810814.1 retroviral-like aspartic protease family protein [Candidatus Thiodiazotropha sp. (ex Notomyrtea botanica)]MCU7828714.1 retroviral-like aspartic protease family protein [Candidatus Thiodiazotropha sp. (ex Myrtea sp. 'scaly one' KF741663)]